MLVWYGSAVLCSGRFVHVDAECAVARVLEVKLGWLVSDMWTGRIERHRIGGQDGLRGTSS
jgi:hypothetical protein